MVKKNEDCIIYLLNNFHFAGKMVDSSADYILFYDIKTNKNIQINKKAVSHIIPYNI